MCCKSVLTPYMWFAATGTVRSPPESKSSSWAGPPGALAQQGPSVVPRDPSPPPQHQGEATHACNRDTCIEEETQCSAEQGPSVVPRDPSLPHQHQGKGYTCMHQGNVVLSGQPSALSSNAPLSWLKKQQLSNLLAHSTAT